MGHVGGFERPGHDILADIVGIDLDGIDVEVDKKKSSLKEKILLKIFSEAQRAEDDRCHPEEKKCENFRPEDGQAVPFQENSPDDLAEIAKWV